MCAILCWTRHGIVLDIMLYTTRYCSRYYAVYDTVFVRDIMLYTTQNCAVTAGYILPYLHVTRVPRQVNTIVRVPSLPPQPLTLKFVECALYCMCKHMGTSFCLFYRCRPLHWISLLYLHFLLFILFTALYIISVLGPAWYSSRSSDRTSRLCHKYISLKECSST